jgi:hypothetical protein
MCLDKRTIVVLGTMAVVFHVAAGLVNVWHWWGVGWDATSYHFLVPYLGLAGWIFLVVVYWYHRVESWAAWLVAGWWLVYEVILLCMVHGVII